MNTSDPGVATVPTPVSAPDTAGTQRTGESLTAAMAALLDPTVIARMANEFFSALPGSPVPPSTALPPAPPAPAATIIASALPATSLVDLGALPVASAIPPASALAPPTEAELRPLPATVTGTTGLPLPAAATAPAAPLGPYKFRPEVVPGLLFASPPVSPPSAPSASAVASALPATPPIELGTSSPPTAADLRALPASLAGTTALASELPGAVPPTTAPRALPYFLDGARATPPAATPFFRLESLELRPELVPNLGFSARPFDPRAVRRDFPILQERVHGRPLIWLDNAATTQKPSVVIERLDYYYRHENSNIHRAAHTLAARATDAYEGTREKVRRFLNAASAREIVFVRGTTEGINLVAQAWGRRNVGQDDEIVITWLEHHANIVPWQQLCVEKGARLRVAPVDDRGQVLLEEYEKLLGPRTRLVAFSHVSNALGTITPVHEMVEIAHRYGARVLVDGAQAVSHMRVDVQTLDCDWYVFSGHEVFAPTGIGIVFGKEDLLNTTPPWQGGGNMILDVTFEKTIYQPAPTRFEAGTGSIADAVGLGAALDYLDQISIENVTRYEQELLTYATAGLASVPGLRLIGTAREKAGVLSFVLDGVRTEDVGEALDQEGIAVRAGHHCAQPILRRFGLESTVRPSLALYNTCEDIDALVAALLRIQAGRGHRGL